MHDFNSDIDRFKPFGGWLESYPAHSDQSLIDWSEWDKLRQYLNQGEQRTELWGWDFWAELIALKVLGWCMILPAGLSVSWLQHLTAITTEWMKNSRGESLPPYIATHMLWPILCEEETLDVAKLPNKIKQNNHKYSWIINCLLISWIKRKFLPAGEVRYQIFL